MKTIYDIKNDKKLKAVKTSKWRGYVSRKTEGYAKPYKGKYGTGFCVYRPNWDSTRYSFVTYYILTNP